MLTPKPFDPKQHQRKRYMLLAQLALAVVLMIFLFRLASNLGPTGNLSSPARNNPLTYHSEQWGFYVSVPDSNWKFSPVLVTDSLRSSEEFATLLEATQPLVRMTKTIPNSLPAYAEVGVLRPQPPRLSRDLAALSLEQIHSQFRSATDSVAIIAPVTPVTSKIMDAAFFVVEIPTGVAITPTDFTVWVCTYFTRRERAYMLLCKTRSADYNLLLQELTRIIETFRMF